MHKVLGVGPIANDAWAPPLPHAIVGFDDVESVDGTVVLALAVDGGIADHHIIEPPLGEGIAEELLADDFAGSVDDGSRRRPVGEKGRRLKEVAGQSGSVAIDGARGGEHQLPYAGDAAGLDDVLRA